MMSKKKKKMSKEHSLDDLLDHLFQNNKETVDNYIEPLITDSKKTILNEPLVDKKLILNENEQKNSNWNLTSNQKKNDIELKKEFDFNFEQINQQQAILEAALFTAGTYGIKISDMKRMLFEWDLNSDYLHNLLKKMMQNYNNNQACGITIEKFDDTYKLITKNQLYKYLSKIIKVQLKSALTNSLIEVLAIIAYNEPCSKSLIQKIRNIDPINSIDKLIKLDLIFRYKRAETPGKPWLYKLTNKFYDVFGIKSTSQLPKISNNFISEENSALNEIADNNNFFNINRNNNNDDEIDDDLE